MIRLCIQQPSLPKYRVPVFRELASRPGIDPTVLYGEHPGVPNVAPEGFEGRLVKLKRRVVAGHPFIWHTAMLEACDGRADVAVLTWDIHYLSLVPALRRGRRRGVGTIVWGHGFSKTESGTRLRARRWAARQADGVLLYSRREARRLVEAGFDPSRVFVAPNSLDLAPVEQAAAAWKAEPGRLERFREAHGLCEGPVLLFVSRLGPERRVDLLLRAAATLRGEFPKLRVVLVGAGPDVPRLEALSQELGIADCVEFAGAIYEEEELAPYFLSATAFCFPNYVGLSVLHAMGYGLPVITTDDAAQQGPEIDAVEDGVNGRLYAAGSADDLAAKIREVIGDKQLRARLAEGALQTVAEKYNVGIMVDGIVEAAESALKRR
jgi:glycosyltransferase involved in cell wall biosynthesis